MPSTSCDIHFDTSPSRVFYGGQTLSGRVVLKLYKEKTVRGIYVKIIGNGYCRWTTGSNKNKSTHIGEECYLNNKTFFVGSESDEIVVRPGEYNYTFSCVLPVNLPTSVEGNTGYIRYSVIVNLDRPMWPDQEYEEFFTVLKPLNLNENVALRYPISRELRKQFFICCLLICCETDPFFLNVRIPVGGYTPGQPIELFMDVNNKSDETFDQFNIQIIKFLMQITAENALPLDVPFRLQHIQYHTHANSSRTTYDEIEMVTKSCTGCNKNQSKTFTVNVIVPPVPPTDLSSSNIVKVSYFLRITAPSGCCRSDPVMEIPITIGTYPILLSNTMGGNTAITQQPTPLAAYPSGNNGDSALVPLNTAMEPTPSYATAPPFESVEGIDPPTYEEAVPTISSDAKRKPFKPLYPYYNRTPSYSADTNQ